MKTTNFNLYLCKEDLIYLVLEYGLYAQLSIMKEGQTYGSRFAAEMTPPWHTCHGRSKTLETRRISSALAGVSARTGMVRQGKPEAA